MVLKESSVQILEKIKTTPEYFATVSAEYQDNIDCAFAAIAKNPQMIRYASDRLKDDEDLALLALHLDATTWIYISPRLKIKYRGLCPFLVIQKPSASLRLQMSM